MGTTAVAIQLAAYCSRGERINSVLREGTVFRVIDCIVRDVARQRQMVTKEASAIYGVAGLFGRQCRGMGAATAEVFSGEIRGGADRNDRVFDSRLNRPYDR